MILCTKCIKMHLFKPHGIGIRVRFHVFQPLDSPIRMASPWPTAMADAYGPDVVPRPGGEAAAWLGARGNCGEHMVRLTEQRLLGGNFEDSINSISWNCPVLSYLFPSEVLKDLSSDSYSGTKFQVDFRYQLVLGIGLPCQFLYSHHPVGQFQGSGRQPNPCRNKPRLCSVGCCISGR